MKKNISKSPLLTFKINDKIFQVPIDAQTQYTVVKKVKGKTALEYLRDNPGLDYTTKKKSFDCFYSSRNKSVTVPNKVWQTLLYKPDGDVLYSPVPEKFDYKVGRHAFNLLQYHIEDTVSICFPIEDLTPSSVLERDLESANVAKIVETFPDDLPTISKTCDAFSTYMWPYLQHTRSAMKKTHLRLCGPRTEFYFYFSEPVENFNVEIDHIEFTMEKLQNNIYKVHDFKTDGAGLTLKHFSVPGRTCVEFSRIENTNILFKGVVPKTVTVFGQSLNVLLSQGGMTNFIYSH